MANVKTYLNKILSAIYGKEVRSSIHDAIDAINTQVETTTKAEGDRVSAERNRVNAENARVDAETNRASAESLRVKAEISRRTQEAGRNAQEIIRKNSEKTRITSETARTNAESTRVSQENSRKSEEAKRISAEFTRVQTENERKTAEVSRVQAEKNRELQEQQRQKDEKQRVVKERDRSLADQERKQKDEQYALAEEQRNIIFTKMQQEFTKHTQKGFGSIKFINFSPTWEAPQDGFILILILNTSQTNELCSFIEVGNETGANAITLWSDSTADKPALNALLPVQVGKTYRFDHHEELITSIRFYPI